MPVHPDDQHFLRLSMTNGVGPRTAHKLISAFGSVLDALHASEKSLAPVVGEVIARKLRAAIVQVEEDAVAKALAWLDAPDHHLLTWSHPRYPKALLETVDAPIALFALGDLSALEATMLAMVGSRNCSQGGADTAEAFSQALAEAGLVVVSGLAQGIDAAAHTGALRAKRQGAKTLAVVGTGIDRVYPAKHKALAHAIAESGLILSEYPLGAAPLAEHFPRRNRIISGLAKGVLVVEASMQSGSLITARLAAEQGRDVFAIPGSIHSTFHKGCHHLIKQGAKLVESSQDVLEELRVGDLPRALAQTNPGKAPSQAESVNENALFAHLEYAPLDVDTLVARSGMDVAQVTSELTLLELNGEAESLPGGLWQRRQRLE